MSNTKSAALTERQTVTLMKVLVALVSRTDGELSEYALEADHKAATPRQLQALVNKGRLVYRTGTMVMPKGVYAGQTFSCRYYSVPE